MRFLFQDFNNFCFANTDQWWRSECFPVRNNIAPIGLGKTITQGKVHNSVAVVDLGTTSTLYTSSKCDCCAEPFGHVTVSSTTGQLSSLKCFWLRNSVMPEEFGTTSTLNNFSNAIVVPATLILPAAQTAKNGQIQMISNWKECWAPTLSTQLRHWTHL